MGVSTVTISIEEFESLISCKRKLDKIKELTDNNIGAIRETNSLAIKSLMNLIYMVKIMEVLESETNESRNKTKRNN